MKAAPSATVQLVLLVSTLAELSCLPLFKQDPFDKLNSYLMKHEESDDLDLNMDVAKQILDQPSADPKLIELTKQFVDMAKPGRFCDLETLEPISEVFRSMKQYVKEPLKDQRRLSKLIVRFAAGRSRCLYDLAEDEWGKYPNSWTVTKMTYHLTASGRDKFFFSDYNNVVTALKLQKRSLNTLFTPNDVYMALLDIKGNGMLLNKVDKQEVGGLLEAFLFGQCEYGKEELRVLDAAVAILSSVEPSDKVTPRMPQDMSILLEAVANYLTCKRLEVTNKEKLVDSVYWLFKKSQKGLN